MYTVEVVELLGGGVSQGGVDAMAGVVEQAVQALAVEVARQARLQLSGKGCLGEADAPVGRLHVTAPPGLGVCFVVPVLEAFQQKHSQLSVELAFGTGFHDLGAENIDVAIL